VGWWEGQTLVIDTVGFAPNLEIFYDVPNGGHMHVFERYQLIDGGDRLRVDLTLRILIAGNIHGCCIVPRTRHRVWQLGSSGHSFVDLTPPAEGSGIGKGK
jgi:hypothetical protein